MPAPTVATVVVLLVQVPPAVAFVKTDVLDGQTLSVPPIGAGTGFTDTVFSLMQPVANI